MTNEILLLIKCDLINAKMINSFNRLGIEASTYRVNIAPVILHLLEVSKERRTDELYEHYYDLLDKFARFDLTTGSVLNTIAQSIYTDLNKLIKK
ncbi:MAG: hypothetical protein ACO1O6_13720 [Bacteroidota bacterium]